MMAAQAEIHCNEQNANVVRSSSAGFTDPKSSAPRPVSLASVPGLLSMLQNEYDATMLETFQLRKQYEAVRQELAHALYANDAANRVVARLMFERDQAREALANIQSSLGGQAAASSSGAASAQPSATPAAAAPVTQDEEMTDNVAAPAALPESVATVFDETLQRLSTERRAKMKRKTVPEKYHTSQDISAMAPEHSAKMTSGRTSQKGINSLDISRSGKLAVAGGKDRCASFTTLAPADVDIQVSDALKVHEKPVIDAKFSRDGTLAQAGPVAAGRAGEVPQYVVTISEDETAAVWSASDGGRHSLLHHIKDFPSRVTSLSVHPSGQFVAFACIGGEFILYQLETGKRVAIITEPKQESQEETAGGYAYESVCWHPDGILLALGTAGGVVRVWDVKAGSKAATLRSADVTTAITSIDFSENGYYLAIASTGANLVKVWDLRKLSEAGSISAPGSSVAGVKFDPSAQFLAVASDYQLSVYANKTWQQLYTGSPAEGAESDNKALTGLDWEARTGSIYVVDTDRNLSRFSKPGFSEA